MPTPNPLLLLLLLVLSSPPAQPLSSSFSFSFLHPTFHFLDVHGGAAVAGGSLTLPPNSTATYAGPLAFGRSPSFSLDLTFSLPGNATLAFFLSPSRSPPVAALAVEFANSHVRVRVGGASAGNALAPSREGTLRSRVDYDAGARLLEVRMGGIETDTVLTSRLDLSGVIWRDAMFAGVRSTGGEAAKVYVWSFGVRSVGPYLMHSEPLDPDAAAEAPRTEAGRRGRRPLVPSFAVALAIGAACGAAIGLLLVSLSSERHPVAPVWPDGFECADVAVWKGGGGGGDGRKGEAFGDGRKPCVEMGNK